MRLRQLIQVNFESEPWYVTSSIHAWVSPTATSSSQLSGMVSPSRPVADLAD